MKRTFALVILLAALGVLSKLAFRTAGTGPQPGTASFSTSPVAGEPAKAEIDTLGALARLFPDASADDRALIARVGDRFRRNALLVAKSDGLRGLRLLDHLDLEAVFLYDKHPKEFRQLRDLLSDDAAADVLLHWREYFGFKRADDTDRAILIDELAGLSPRQRRLAGRFPSALPLVLAEPAGMSELVDTYGNDDAALGEALTILSLISLETGAADIRAALRTLENHRALALDAFRRHGVEGFALVTLYGPVLEALGGALPLDQALILLRVNSDYVDELLRTHRPETVAGHLGHVAASGLVEAVGGSPRALRLAVEFGEPGERALAKAGPDAAEVVFNNFADPVLRNRAVAALGEYGTMALVILDKYATDTDFREILRAVGPAVIPPVARADASPEALAMLQSKEHRSFAESVAKLALLTSGENGQAVIRMIKADGLDRVTSLNDGEVRFYQFLPLYDLLHLGNVLRRGSAPTSGEMTWALVDGCFVVADVLSLAAIQPEGAIAAELARSEVKAAAREGARSIGREVVEAGGSAAGKAVAGGTEAAARRLSRWWAVRSAGGVYQVLRRLPEALPKMSLSQLVATAQPLCTKAGLRLSTWRPFQLLREGLEVPLRIPPQRGLKYVGAQMVQASVGVVGFQKMEEHLASRRPKRT